MSIFQRYVLIYQGSKNAYEMLCVGTRQTPLLMKKKKGQHAIRGNQQTAPGVKLLLCF